MSVVRGTTTRSSARAGHERPQSAGQRAGGELSARERAVIQRLLQPGFDGAEAFRRQLLALRAVRRAPCCESIQLLVDSAAAPRLQPAPFTPGAVVERPLPWAGRWRSPVTGAELQVLLFERRGWLSHLEIEHDEVDHVVALPAPEELALTAAL